LLPHGQGGADKSESEKKKKEKRTEKTQNQASIKVGSAAPEKKMTNRDGQPRFAEGGNRAVVIKE